MLAEAAFATLYGQSPAADMEQLARRAVALAPAGDAARPRPRGDRARGRRSCCRGARRPPSGSPRPPRWSRRRAALRDDPRLAALVGVPAAFLRSGPDAYEPLARAIALARERGATGVLPFALFYLGVGSAREPALGRGGGRTSRRRCGSPARPGCASTRSPRWRR